MTTIAASASNASTWFDTVFAAVIANCAAFCAGARQGCDIEHRYHTLARRSGVDLARIGLTRAEIARAALTGSRN